MICFIFQGKNLNMNNNNIQNINVLSWLRGDLFFFSQTFYVFKMSLLYVTNDFFMQRSFLQGKKVFEAQLQQVKVSDKKKYSRLSAKMEKQKKQTRVSEINKKNRIKKKKKRKKRERKREEKKGDRKTHV
eukprot:TRINITY_DN20234_c0_g1_i5.p2 TRINITY_DN20234_c0_g1~~TRINITY_DN20234_c0_g1_i5.p2  ORF type:complete len:130 (-),score=2.21 TRINITY_DN20234_c0_g1_i5:71-460(-)